MDMLALTKSLGVEGFLHPNEMERLVQLAANREVLEVGSFRGLSAFCMAISAVRVTCCDTFAANSAGQVQEDHVTTLDDFLRATARFNNVRHFVASSAKAEAELELGEFDLIFLDAMHTYEDVVADIVRWWPRVRNGGVLALHDYGHDHFLGVKQAADEIFGPAPEGTHLVTLRWIEKG